MSKNASGPVLDNDNDLSPPGTVRRALAKDSKQKEQKTKKGMPLTGMQLIPAPFWLCNFAAL